MIETVYLDWEKLPVQSVIQCLIQIRRNRCWVDLSEDILVVPTARSYRRVISGLVEECSSRCLRLVPPKMLLPGSMLESLFPFGRHLDDASRLLLWIRALERHDTDFLENLFPGRLLNDDLSQRLPVARDMDSLYREVSLGGYSFAQVADRANSHHYDDSERWLNLAALQESYWAEVEAYGAIDLYHKALFSAQPESEHSYLLAGVAGLPPVVERLLENSLSRVTVLIPAPESDAEMFSPFGRPLAEQWRKRAILLAEENVLYPANFRQQLEILECLCKPLSQQGDASAITICCPDTTASEKIQGFLSEKDISVHSGSGTPFRESELGRLLKLLRVFLHSSTSDSCARLVRHPITLAYIERRTAGELNYRTILQALDDFQATHLQNRVSAESQRLGSRNFQRIHEIVLSLSEHLSVRCSLREWARKLLSVIEDLCSSMGEDWLEKNQAAIQLFLSAVVALEEAPPTHQEVGHDGMLILEQLLSSQVLTPESPLDGVELVGWLEMVFDDAPLTILTSLHRDTLPEAPKVSPFLTETMRRQLGLPNYEERLARDAFYLTLLSKRTPSPYLIAHKRGDDGIPLHLSPLLLKETPKRVATRILSYYGKADTLQVSKPQIEENTAPETSSFSGFFPPRVLREYRGPFSASCINTYLRCPFEFYLTYVERVRSVSDRERELGPLAFGTLVHRALVQIKDLNGVEIDVLRGGILEELRRLKEELFLPSPLPAIEIQHLYAENLVNLLIKVEHQCRSEGWQTWSTEWDLTSCPDPSAILGLSGTLQGKLDRIDYHPASKRFRIIDYKTGLKPVVPHSKRTRTKDGWTDLQLPLYYHAFRQYLDSTGQEYSAIELGYCCLTPRAPKPLVLAEWDKTDLEEALHILQSVTLNIINGNFWPPSGKYSEGALASLFLCGVQHGY